MYKVRRSSVNSFFGVARSVRHAFEREFYVKKEGEPAGRLIIDNMVLKDNGEYEVVSHYDRSQDVISPETRQLWLAHAPTEQFRRKIEKIVDELNKKGRQKR